MIVRFACGAALALSLACMGERGGAFRPMAVGDVVGAYTVATLEGDTVRLGGAERLTVLNVWATWCTECREEMAELQALHTEFAPRGVRVVGVSVDKGDGSRVQQFTEQERLTFTIALDPDGRVQRLYQVVGVPETFVIGSDGRLLWRWIGNLRPAVDSVRAVLAGAIQGS